MTERIRKTRRDGVRQGYWIGKKRRGEVLIELFQGVIEGVYHGSSKALERKRLQLLKKAGYNSLREYQEAQEFGDPKIEVSIWYVQEIR